MVYNMVYGIAHVIYAPTDCSLTLALFSRTCFDRGLKNSGGLWYAHLWQATGSTLQIEGKLMQQ